MARDLLAGGALLLTVLVLASCSADTGTMPPEPRVAVDAAEISAGGTVDVAAEGFPPGREVVVGAGPVASEYEVLARPTVAADGSVSSTVTVPDWAELGRAWVVVVEVPGPGGARAVSQELVVRGGTTRGAVTVTGRLTDEGVECQALRGDDDALYTLTGDLGGASIGDRVRVVGVPAEMSFCMQGTTLGVRSIEVLD